MTSTKPLLRLIALPLLILGTGCGRAYHCYSDCCVDCHYHAAAPLPYAHYDPHACHACVASQYLPVPQVGSEMETAESGENESSE